MWSPPLLLFLSLMLASADGHTLLDELARNAVTSVCRQQVGQLQKEQQDLVSKLTRASTRFPEELFSGNIYSIGRYEECMNITSELGQGKYCLVNVEVGRVNTSSTSKEISLVFKHEGDRLRLPRNKFRWGFCIPSECTASDIEQALETTNVLQKHGVRLQVNVSKYSCQTAADVIQTQQDGLLETDAAAFLVITCLLIILTVASSISHHIGKKTTGFRNTNEIELQEVGVSRDQAGPIAKPDSVWKEMFSAFAVQTNWSKLQGERIGKVSKQIDCINGMKMMTMVGVILGHASWAYTGGPIDNPEWVEQQYTHPLGPMLYNGHSVVQTFFVITGILEAVTILTMFEKVSLTPTILLTMYFNRALRILPAFMFILWFNSSVMYKMGSGPLWTVDMGPVVEDCHTYWWSDLLFIGNYVSPHTKCMYHTWYLAMDMQMYLVTPVIVYLMYRRPAIGRRCLYLLLSTVIVSGFAYTFINQLEPVPLITPEVNRGFNPFKNKTFQNFYTKVYNNSGSYIVGLLIGQLLYRIRTKDVALTQISKTVLGTGCWVAFFMNLTIVLSGQAFYTQSYVYNPYVSATYASLHGVLFGFGSGFIILASATGNGGVIHKILSMQPLRVLGRLTFCAYLIHPTIIYITSRSFLSLTNVSVFSTTAYTNQVSAYSYLWGLVLNLLIEAPLANIQRMFLQRSE